MTAPAILDQILDIAWAQYAKLGPARMPRVYHLNPRDWDAVREYAEKSRAQGLPAQVYAPKPTLFPRFTVETDLGDLVFQSSQFQQSGSFVATEG